jgi:hypothetical protein
MYIVETKFTRPGPDVPYYLDTDLELKERFKNFACTITDYVLYFESINESECQQVTVTVFVDEAAYNRFIDYFNDTFPGFFEDRDNYCITHGIEVEKKVEEY